MATKEKVKERRVEIMEAVEKAVAGISKLGVEARSEVIIAASLQAAIAGAQVRATFEVAEQLAELNETLGHARGVELDQVPVHLVQQLSRLNQKLEALAAVPSWVINTLVPHAFQKARHVIQAPSARDAIAIAKLRTEDLRPRPLVVDCRLATAEEVANG